MVVENIPILRNAAEAFRGKGPHRRSLSSKGSRKCYVCACVCACEGREGANGIKYQQQANQGKGCMGVLRIALFLELFCDL